MANKTARLIVDKDKRGRAVACELCLTPKIDGCNLILAYNPNTNEWPYIQLCDQCIKQGWERVPPGGLIRYWSVECCDKCKERRAQMMACEESGACAENRRIVEQGG